VVAVQAVVLVAVAAHTEQAVARMDSSERRHVQ
jgi:hypothetical protein